MELIVDRRIIPNGGSTALFSSLYFVEALATIMHEIDPVFRSYLPLDGADLTRVGPRSRLIGKQLYVKTLLLVVLSPGLG
jgi:hypothetical protein